MFLLAPNLELACIALFCVSRLALWRVCTVQADDGSTWSTLNRFLKDRGISRFHTFHYVDGPHKGKKTSEVSNSSPTTPVAQLEVPGAVADITAEATALSINNAQDDHKSCMSASSDVMFGCGAGEDVQKGRAGSGAHTRGGEGMKKNGAKICASCAEVKKAMQRCERCKATYYCNHSCQLAHWQVHKQACLAAAQLSGLAASAGLVVGGAVGAVGVAEKSEFASRALTDEEECSICLELVNEPFDFQLPW